MKCRSGNFVKTRSKICGILCRKTHRQLWECGNRLSQQLSHVTAEVDCNKAPAFVDPKECCAVPNLISEELVEKCKGNEPPPPPPSGEMNNEVDESEQGGPGRHHHHRHGPHGHHGRHGHHHHHCFPTCLFNETGILIDGELQEDNLDTFLSGAAAENPEVLPILKESFQTCYQKSVEIMEKIREHWSKNENSSRRPPHHHHRHHHCSPQAGIMFHCAMMNTFKQCPDSIWSDTDECNNVREYFTECMPSPDDQDDDEEEEE
ncbi:general odorant-binding protein 67 isoform X1 [Musca domestica]|uniref:General odorant-binding protein 67 isoform X1 n=1 Tax=Musca domestica TaxID=7370 RepID=A0A1I8NEA8_MUSDO|nr:general odorant-binding protein 67 isoform X1 [Musca domestica]